MKALVLFWHVERDLQCVTRCVFVYLLWLTSVEEVIDWIMELMKTGFEIKVRATLDPEEDDDKEGVILGRIWRWHNWGIKWEAHLQHCRLIVDYFGLQVCHSDGLSLYRDKERKHLCSSFGVE